MQKGHTNYLIEQQTFLQAEPRDHRSMGGCLSKTGWCLSNELSAQVYDLLGRSCEDLLDVLQETLIREVITLWKSDRVRNSETSLFEHRGSQDPETVPSHSTVQYSTVQQYSTLLFTVTYVRYCGRMELSSHVSRDLHRHHRILPARTDYIHDTDSEHFVHATSLPQISCLH